MAQPVYGAALPQSSRRIRNPRHPFAVRFSPFQITPFLISAVLPGETLKSALIQAKAKSAALKNEFLGCTLEQYYYYIPLRFLPNGDDFVQMVVDPAYEPPAGLTSSTDKPEHYFAASAAAPGIDFVQQCLDHVVAEFFRNEDEAPGSHTLNGRYAARVQTASVVHSLLPAAEFVVDDPVVDADGDGVIRATEVGKAYQMWQALVTQGRTEKSYEDFLRGYGLRAPVEEVKRAEEIRVVREWVLPSIRSDYTTGLPSNVWQWTVQDRIDKMRFMKEPGFIFGITVQRPKVFFANLKGTTTAHMKSALSWLPGEVLNSLAYGLPEFAAGTGPMEAATVPYVFDLRDLLQYGEQFVNFDLTETGQGMVALPKPDATVTNYVSWADVQSLFVSGTATQTHCEGMVSLNIASRLGSDLTEAS